MIEPGELGEGGMRLWSGVLAEFELEDWQLILLVQACRCKDHADRLAPLAATLDSAAMREARLTALAMSRLLAALRLPDRTTGRRPQRRGGARGSYGRRGP